MMILNPHRWGVYIESKDDEGTKFCKTHCAQISPTSTLIRIWRVAYTVETAILRPASLSFHFPRPITPY